ncbi:MAG: CDP-diacylglycerol--glycerol-3-phosphate 3-phosphatidyltransferase [Pirellulales bacterium]|nr:CDP-diacylglycerol--glycerol-3-phosphate 3-phosphatidyltransferase [Pirellulales bacterium]
MNTESQHSSRRLGVRLFNLPNQLTTLRLILSVILFGFLSWGTCWAYWTSFVLFIVAASTDWLDGYYARKYGMVTTLGRILDPFADKIIICGTLMFLAVDPGMAAVEYGLRMWMVVVVVARELLVTTIRSFIEERGGDFSATWSGKIKMGFQCVAAGACIFYLTYSGQKPPQTPPAWIWLTLVVSLWAAVVSTIYSGAVYVVAAIKQLRE